MLLLLLWACDSDVSIIKRVEETGQSLGVGEPGEPVAIAPQPSAEQETDQVRSGVTGLSTMYLRQIACPACMGETQELTVEYEANFHQPITDSWNSWPLSDGTCDQYLYQATPSTQPINVGQVIQVTSQNHQFDAYQSAAGTYQSQTIWESHLQRNTEYNVQTSEGSFSFTTIEGFDYIEPYTMLWVDPSYAFEAAVRRSGFTVTWAPVRAASRMMITLGIYSSDGASLLGQVSCFGADNGSMFIPSQYLNYPVWSLVAIHIERFETDIVETDINNSYMETMQIWEVVGTGHIE
ncbi:hypothetical protein N8467_01055 [bacterium]|nr:hypothetical protein [bacterium]